MQIAQGNTLQCGLGWQHTVNDIGRQACQSYKSHRSRRGALLREWGRAFVSLEMTGLAGAPALPPPSGSVPAWMYAAASSSLRRARLAMRSCHGHATASHVRQHSCLDVCSRIPIPQPRKLSETPNLGTACACIPKQE